MQRNEPAKVYQFPERKVTGVGLLKVFAVVFSVSFLAWCAIFAVAAHRVRHAAVYGRSK
jgi:hypothetical protein